MRPRQLQLRQPSCVPVLRSSYLLGHPGGNDFKTYTGWPRSQSPPHRGPAGINGEEKTLQSLPRPWNSPSFPARSSSGEACSSTNEAGFLLPHFREGEWPRHRMGSRELSSLLRHVLQGCPVVPVVSDSLRNCHGG